jgi:hypothetical protein
MCGLVFGLLLVESVVFGAELTMSQHGFGREH